VALPEILPLSTKLVVAETSLKLLFTRQPAHQVVKLIERLSATAGALAIPFECPSEA
jgi:hypothetical protein